MLWNNNGFRILTKVVLANTTHINVITNTNTTHNLLTNSRLTNNGPRKRRAVFLMCLYWSRLQPDVYADKHGISKL